MIVCHMGLRPDNGVQSRVHRHPQRGETPAKITFPGVGAILTRASSTKSASPVPQGLNWKAYGTASDGIGSTVYRCSAVACRHHAA